MKQSRLVLPIASVSCLLLGALVGWFAAQASHSKPEQAVQMVGEIPVGKLHSKAGALAAADNYAAVGSEMIGHPSRFDRFVRVAYIPATVEKTLKDAEDVRSNSTKAAANYAAGGKELSIVAARRLQSYDGKRAVVLAWTAGFSWGPKQAPTQRWALVETHLVWQDDQWRIESIGELKRRAPIPALVLEEEDGQDKPTYFDQELAGMRSPLYGAG